MLIRAATPNDLPTLLGFEQGIVGAERPYDPTLRPGEIHYYDLAALIVDPETRVVVAEADHQLIGSGYAQIRRSDPFVAHERHAFLGFMYVVPDARGRGVNQAIIDALASWARERGVSELVLEVYAANARAVRAYDKAGFVPRLLEMRLDLGR